MSRSGTCLTFFVNGKKICETSPDPKCTLLQYLRRTLFLPGTKEGCGHGGCGSCTVMVSRYDFTSKRIKYPKIATCFS
ncbi:xanthine dehydrogenase-like isoform X2 [Ruditapes philippinarum]|uniref:xanthine dehydrogenase-like isoform X1 n=1 Tax=Ruditapes philippinarum TaxID=129788 RepID=UPI00295B8760|nr:xanthine dehydrogenase-like isoform X1 [Ruditapes philippinarum]XP_060585999.1 xanthine dehydrogenase-like isoform X2 [Ruditapes philippinarum]